MSSEPGIDIGAENAVIVLAGMCELVIRLVALGAANEPFTSRALDQVLKSATTDLKNTYVTGATPKEEAAIMTNALALFRTMALAAMDEGLEQRGGVGKP